MCDREIDDVRDWRDGCVQTGDVHDGVADGIVVVDADIREIEKILPRRMADEVAAFVKDAPQADDLTLLAVGMKSE